MISKAQWQQVQQQLSGLYGQAVFQLDGHEITIQRGQLSENKLGLSVFIDGVMAPRHGFEPSDDYLAVTQKVWAKKFIWAYSPAKQKSMIKSLGKRRLRELCPNYDKKREYRVPIFSSARTLIGQYKKLDGLVLVKIGTQEVV